MDVTIFGSGYVGLVSGTCLAEVGNNVVCVDIDQKKIDMLNNGQVPIFEPGLDKMIERNMKEGRLSFTTNIDEAVKHGLFQFIAVGTPPDEDGSADLQYVRAVAKSIGEHMDEYRVIIDKSTVPVGTADKVRESVEAALKARNLAVEFDVVSNPEFLKEGDAIDDFMKPDRIVIGTDNPRTTELLRALYAPFNRSHDRMVAMDIRSAELTKYAANSLLATKITFMNELANIAERLGADIENVRLGIGSDPRIGYHFIYPGCGYGGSCFPKDVSALEKTAKQVGYDAKLLTAVETVNNKQKTILFDRIKNYFNGDVKGKTIALWGLSFKPNTDDMRDAPSRVLMEALWEAGAKVQVYDPEAMEETQRIYGQRDDLVYCDEPMDVFKGADVMALLTEWRIFRSPDFNAIKAALANPVIFDGRNVYDPIMMKELGFEYYGMGRGLSCVNG